MATAAILLVIVIVATGGYFLLTQNGTASTSTQQPSSTTSSSGVPNPIYASWNLAAGYQVSLPDLLGNYSQMAFAITTVGLNYSEYVNQTESYAVVGHPVLDGAPTTEVISNATLLAVSNGKVAARVTENNAVWMASNGTLLRSDENGTVRTGAAIGAPDELITPFVLGGPFTYAVDILSMNSTLVKEMTNSTVSVGSTKMAATSWGQTTALASSFVIFGFGYTFSVVVGVAQGASFYVPVSVSVIGPPLLVGFQSADTSTVVTLVSIARA